MLTYDHSNTVLRNPWRRKPDYGSVVDWFHPMTAGLGICLPFNDFSPAGPRDASAQCSGGSLAGSASYAPGVFGGPALSLTGGNAQLTSTTALDTYLGQQVFPFSVLAWVNWTASTESYNSIAAKEVFGGNGWTLLLKSNQTIAYYMTDTGGATINQDGSSGVVSFGRPHMVAATWNGLASTSARIASYIDGVVSAVTTPGHTTWISQPAAPLLIGNSVFGSGRFFSGKIDLLMTFRRAVTAAEIAELYAQPFLFFRKPSATTFFLQTPAGSGTNAPFLLAHF